MASFRYLFHNGKNSKIKYYAISYIRLLIPRFIYRLRLDNELKKVDRCPDAEYIKRRVDYYNKVNHTCELADDAIALKNVKVRDHASVYFFDFFEFARWFSPNLRCSYVPGDISRKLPTYAVTKSRPIGDDNENSVIMKLEKNRHFTFLKDTIPFEEKRNKVIFRGKILRKENRIDFMKKFYDDPMFDIGNVDHNSAFPQEWKKEKMSYYDHLESKFIMSLEGNDVASNLKWIMSSNSIAVSPRLTCETWFMEGTLIPNYHYIEIKEDFSDLKEKLQYYIDHPKEANAIIRHAHEYIEQFKDCKREKLISLLVLDKYFRMTQQR